MLSIVIPASPSPKIPPASQPRTVRLVHPIEGDLPGQIEIRCGTRTCHYQLDPVPTPDEFRGQGYKLTSCHLDPSEEPREYHVLLSEQGCSCECLGYLRHDRCKHIEALLTLVREGQI